MSELWVLETSHAVLSSCPPPELEMCVWSSPSVEVSSWLPTAPLLWPSTDTWACLDCSHCSKQDLLFFKNNVDNSTVHLEGLFCTKAVYEVLDVFLFWAEAMSVCEHLLQPLTSARIEHCRVVSLLGVILARDYAKGIVKIQLLVSNLIWHLTYSHFAIQNVNVLNSRLYFINKASEEFISAPFCSFCCLIFM